MALQNFTFDNPPVYEVIVAVYFDPPVVDFKSQHVGLFWERIKERFPVVHQQAPLGVSGVMSSEEPFPMPGYWFVAADDVNIVQVQKEAFLFNWRRRNANRYPGFHDGVKPSFDQVYDEFEEFLMEEVGVAEVPVGLCELTYVDIIERCDYWQGPAQTQGVVPAFSNPLPNFGNGTESQFDCSFVYSVDEDIELFFRIRTLVDPQQSDQPVLALEMKASNIFGGVQRARTDRWFQKAHDTILEHFISMTNEQVQRDHWGIRTGDKV